MVKVLYRSAWMNMPRKWNGIDQDWDRSGKKNDLPKKKGLT
jgi:hypothetical protein